MRTPISQRTLTSYSKGEERFNSMSHAFGAVLSVVGLALILFTGRRDHWDSWSMVSGSIYGISLLILYTMSALYHGARSFTAKRVLQIIDHCSIFLLIAGSYTPLTLTILRREKPALAWTILGVVWISAVLGIVLNAIDLKQFSKFSMICYLAMGWSILLVIRPLRALLPSAALWLLLLGGVSYTIGAALYGMAKRKYTWMHGVFHIFVIIGSVLHFFCIFLYILPI